MVSKKTILAILLAIFFMTIGNAQNIRLVDSILPDKLEERHSSYVKNYTLFKVAPNSLQEITGKHLPSFSSTLPLSNTGDRVKLSFVRFDITTPGFTVYDSDNNQIACKPGDYYIAYNKEKGKILGSFAFYPTTFMGVFGWNGNTYNTGKMEDDTYIILKESDVLEPPQFICDFDDYAPENNIREIERHDNPANVMTRDNKCIEVYLEADYKLYLQYGRDIKKTVDYLLGMFAETVLIYQNENINMRVAAIKVWTTPDGYSTTSSNEALRKFANSYNPNAKDLNLLVAVGGKNLGGLAYLRVLCRNYINFAYANINNHYNNIPLYSWDINVITHELGHNIGSPHTHACYWNGDYTQIDDCGNVYYKEKGKHPEGYSCFDEDNPIIPVDGGTIMSYCHLVRGAGIDISNGFGPQPGYILRQNYNNANCLESCEMYGDNPPEADFEVLRNFTCEGGYLKFIDKSLNHPVTWEWTFEKDDSTYEKSYHKLPKIKYEKTGIYDVSLLVKNGKGESEILKKDYIQVIEGPVPDFEYKFLSKDKVQFINKSTNAQKYKWEFGDGLHRYKKDPVHTYKYPGKYVVTLYATRDTCHTTNSITTTIEVKFPVPAKIRYNKDIICKDDSIFFYCSDAPYDSVRWHFEGAAIQGSTERQIWVTYPQSGHFDVTLIAYSHYGNDTLTKKNLVTVITKPKGDFEYTANYDTVSFYHKFEHAEILNWDFGDGQTSKEKNPVHIYGKTGKFNVTLKAINACGQSVIKKEIIISKTGIAETEPERIKLYPNPAHNKVYIEHGGLLHPKNILTVKNIFGKTVLQKACNDNIITLDIQKLKPGIYFIYFDRYDKALKMIIE